MIPPEVNLQRRCSLLYPPRRPESASAYVQRRLLILFLGAQQVAGLAIDEVQPAAGCAFDHFIFVVRNIVVVVQPMLNIQICIWASENECCHPRFVTIGDRYLCYVNPIYFAESSGRVRFSENGYRFRSGLGLAWCADVFFRFPESLPLVWQCLAGVRRLIARRDSD
jgi:hypothetical protein